jgi:hypothetical protein
MSADNPALSFARAMGQYRNALLDSGFQSSEAMFLLAELQKAMIGAAAAQFGPQLMNMLKDMKPPTES